MGAGVGPLVAPAVFRIVVEFKDKSGKIQALPNDYCVRGKEPSVDGKTDYRRIISALVAGEKKYGEPVERKERRISWSLKPIGGAAPIPKIADEAAPTMRLDTQPEGQNAELCHEREFKTKTGVKIVWLPTRQDPSNEDSEITGGIYVIYGDVSVGQAENLNCDVDGNMKAMNVESERRGDKLTLRASANIGPAADENAADWGNRRDVSSTAFGAYCTPTTTQPSGGEEKK